MSNNEDIVQKQNDIHQTELETSSQVSNSSSTELSICVKPKSLEGKEMDNFLVERHMNSISLEQKKEQGLIQEISTSIKDQSQATEFQRTIRQIQESKVLLNLTSLYKKACDAEKQAIKVNQDEITCWYYYIIEFDNQVKNLMKSDHIGEKKAKGQIYDFIIAQLNTKRKTLQKQTQKARKVYNLFEKIGIEYTDDQDDSDDLPETEISILTEETKSRNFLKNLTDDRKRNQARRRLRDGFNLAVNRKTGSVTTSDKNVNIAISNKPSKGIEEETIGDMAQRILRDKLSIRDVRAEAYALALSAPDANAGSSRLSRLRRELRNLNASPEIIDVTKFPDITEDANKIQRDNRKKAEANRIDFPYHFTLESVRERLDAHDIKTLPDCQALADVMVMLCIHPAELKTLRITDAG
ncbi:8406_t:CDS:2, partial [Paraglomus occultum]